MPVFFHITLHFRGRFKKKFRPVFLLKLADFLSRLTSDDESVVQTKTEVRKVFLGRSSFFVRVLNLGIFFIRKIQRLLYDGAIY